MFLIREEKMLVCYIYVGEYMVYRISVYVVWIE